MPKTTTIYALVDPRDHLVYYVGRADNPRHRLTSHLIDARRPNTPNAALKAWLNELVAQGTRPTLIILETAAAGREAVWIERFSQAHAPLLNRRFVFSMRCPACGALALNPGGACVECGYRDTTDGV